MRSSALDEQRLRSGGAERGRDAQSEQKRWPAPLIADRLTTITIVMRPSPLEPRRKLAAFLSPSTGEETSEVYVDILRTGIVQGTRRDDPDLLTLSPK